MKRLTYWIADCLNDSRCYSIREKTRKAVVAKLNDGTQVPGSYGAPRKVTVEYNDTFDLMCMAMGEGGIYEGQAYSRFISGLDHDEQ